MPNSNSREWRETAGRRHAHQFEWERTDEHAGKTDSHPDFPRIRDPVLSEGGRCPTRIPESGGRRQAGGMLISLSGNELTSTLGKQTAIPIFPESETLFFLKVVDAQLEFPRVEGDG